MHPLATLFMNIAKLYKASFQYGAIITSYGWAKSATKYAADAMEAAKIEIVGSVDVNGPALEDDMKAVLELGENLAAKIKTG
jgi:flavorubredoxin